MVPARELCESAWQPPRKMSPLRDRPQFETDDEYKQHLAQRHKQQETLRGIVNEIAASVRVQSASESRLSGVRRLPSKQHSRQGKTSSSGAAACGSGAVADSTQAARVARVHSLSARDVPCRYGLQ